MSAFRKRWPTRELHLKKACFLAPSRFGHPDLTRETMSLSSSQVWKLGWSPKPGGDFGTVFPEIPVEFLQEKEVFKEFIYRINTLGSPGLPSDVVARHHMPTLGEPGLQQWDPSSPFIPQKS